MKLPGRDKYRGRRRNARDRPLERQFNRTGGDQQNFLHLVIMQWYESVRLDPLLPDRCVDGPQSRPTEDPRANPGHVAGREFVMGVNRHGGSITNRTPGLPLN